MDDVVVSGVEDAVAAAGVAITMYLLLIAATRVAGLRSLAQLSAFDLLMTVSIGSMLATTALSPSVPLADGVAAAAALFSAQTIISLLRRRNRAHRVIDNQPLVLMIGTDLIEDHVRKVRMTRGDVMSKLREHGVRDLGEIAVVVLERTGAVSVIRRDDDGAIGVAGALLAEVRGGDRVPQRGQG